MNRKLKVLIIAESANPEFVSVPLVGWSHARALMDVVDGHLVTQIRNRDAIVRAGLIENQDFTVINSEKFASPLYKIGKRLTGGKGKGWTVITAVMGLAYYYFEYLLWKKFKMALISGEYDVVHRVTPLSPTTPSLLASKLKKISVPFVVGPLNGGLPWPKGFGAERRKEREWLSYIRSAYKLMPYYKSTLSDSTAIVVASGATLGNIPEKYQDKCFYLPENGIDRERFPSPCSIQSTSYSGRPLRLVFVGRLVPYKGLDMLVEAAAPLLKEGEVTIDIMGDGPMRQQVEDLIGRCGVSHACKLHGWVAHREIRAELQQGDILALPSIREFGGGVVLEAMALGVVPLVVNYGGPGELVTENTGFSVPLGSREEIVRNLRRTLTAIGKSPDSIAEMRLRCINRAHGQFSWEAKAESMLKIYRWAIGHREERPSFPFPIPDLMH